MIFPIPLETSNSNCDVPGFWYTIQGGRQMWSSIRTRDRNLLGLEEVAECSQVGSKAAGIQIRNPSESLPVMREIKGLDLRITLASG